MTYNGYTNYETWLINQYIIDRQAMTELFTSRQFKCVVDLEDMIRLTIEQVTQQKIVDNEYLISDLVGAALSKVDFNQIAQDFWHDGK
jgi:hypothetical protein